MATAPGMQDLVRVPISFKSSADGNVYRHIVLAIAQNSKWGALGISRRDSLMYKDMRFSSLSDLILEFKSSYAACGHELLKVYVGLPFLHDPTDGPIKWRALKLDVTDNCTWGETATSLRAFEREGPMLAEYLLRSGSLPDGWVEKLGGADTVKRKGSPVKSKGRRQARRAMDGSETEKSDSDSDDGANVRAPPGSAVAVAPPQSSPSSGTLVAPRAMGV